MLAQTKRIISASDLESLKAAKSGHVTNGMEAEPLFHDMTRAIIWGMQSRAVQVSKLEYHLIRQNLVHKNTIICIPNANSKCHI